ncbi:MAG: glutamine--fructose-6-phosphate transaminase (isomerizing) [Thermoplasmatota archaeon]
MCGIIGYTGFRNAKDVLLSCLTKLEYRGYDSAGVGIYDNKIQVFKEIGELHHLKKIVPEISGTIGIGHTRWATHGLVTLENAHPQMSPNKKIMVVHNGIIENFNTLKETLQKKGNQFSSQTDTEVIAHLLEHHYNGDIKETLYTVLEQIKGSYAIVVFCEDEPEKLIAARKETPLLIGVGDNENFITSDVSAILQYTNRVHYLDEGELCVLSNNSIQIFDKNKNSVTKKEDIITWTVKDAEKSGYPHFMLKEIYDQPETVIRALQGRTSEINQDILLPEQVETLLKENIQSIVIIACGTSYYAGLVGKYILEGICNIPVSVELASEYRFFNLQHDTSLVIGITQSGETSDTLAALRAAKKAGCKTLIITNVIGSTATRICDGYILTQSGPEIGVAATKTFTSQIITLCLLGLKLSLIRNTLSPNKIYDYIISLKNTSKDIRYILNNNKAIHEIANQIKDAQSIFFIGRGINYPLSLEGALKLKEISYIHAEGFAAGELKHGTFALLTKETPVIAIATSDATYDKIMANIGEIKARESKVIAIADEGDREIQKHADMVLRYPSNPSFLSCIPITVILQLLAYYVADFRNCSIDKPRNLAKSVTVE